MYTEQLFKVALNGLYSKYKALMPGWYPNKYGQVEEVDRAWKLYYNAAHTQLSMLLLGEEGLRTAKDDLTNFGTTAAYPMANPRHSQANPIRIKEPGQRPVFIGASNRTGSVLSEEAWWPLPNDAWVMGGVHSLTPFYMAMAKVPEDAQLWETRFGGRPRVLGRELIGLAAFGYKRVNYSSEAKLGIVLAPDDKTKATSATFDDYLKVTANYKSAADIKAIFKDSAAVDYDKYTLPTL